MRRATELRRRRRLQRLSRRLPGNFQVPRSPLRLPELPAAAAERASRIGFEAGTSVATVAVRRQPQRRQHRRADDRRGHEPATPVGQPRPSPRRRNRRQAVGQRRRRRPTDDHQPDSKGRRRRASAEEQRAGDQGPDVGGRIPEGGSPETDPGDGEGRTDRGGKSDHRVINDNPETGPDNDAEANDQDFTDDNDDNNNADDDNSDDVNSGADDVEN